MKKYVWILAAMLIIAGCTKKPVQEELEDMIFAFKIVKHAKSSAVVAAKDLRTIVEKWYTQLYREVNWKKIKIWDNVDVYFDPKNPDYYRIDLDYLFGK